MNQQPTPPEGQDATSKATIDYSTLTLPRLCRLIGVEWKNMSPHARPYFDAMCSLTTLRDRYGVESGKSIALYFLSNATSWRGDVARGVKKQLNSLIKQA